MFAPENVPDLVRAMNGTSRILILSVPTQDVVSKIKDAMLGMVGHTFKLTSVSDLFAAPAALDEDQVIVLTDATFALNTDGESFNEFMSLAQRRKYKATVVAIAVLNSYDSHAAQYCMNVRVS